MTIYNHIKDLFFKVYKSSLYASNKHIAVHNYYSVLRESDDMFLGIRRQYQELITNEEVYNKSCKLYKLFTKELAEIQFYIGNQQNNWFAIIIGGCKLSEFVERNRILKGDGDLLMNNFAIDNYSKKFPPSEEVLRTMFLNKISNFEIGFAMVNGYDIDHNPNLFLAILAPSDSKLGILPISRIRLKLEHDSKKQEEDSQTLSSFRTALIDFINEYYERFKVPIEGNELIKAIIFDIHNINLKELVVEIDDNQRKIIIEFEAIVDNFLHSKTNENYSVFSDFLFHFYSIERPKQNYFHYNSYKKVQDNLTLKEIYKKSITRLKNVLSDTDTRSEYDAECKKSYKKAKIIIEKKKQCNTK